MSAPCETARCVNLIRAEKTLSSYVFHKLEKALFQIRDMIFSIPYISAAFVQKFCTSHQGLSILR
ncbi:MAG: hypothetical protein APU95_04265 [Hadesarchaea archaeon YNP_N21]|nr:MAG: hypothetical protein APU95_04265 [Hadesarchaea archaeon YNP_N21]